jgi:REP element-mobilizing transposase RayT
MPRKPRLDWPGALHHVWARGIEKRDIFLDDADRSAFVCRVRRVLADTGCRCFAWALMDNHHHFGLESGDVAVSRVLRRINGPYAAEFNRRHDRVGHLFQGRFGSRLIEPGDTLRELIAYIHLNPVGSPLVPDVAALTDYAWTGHRALIGRKDDGIIDVNGVLGLFGGSRADAREVMVRVLDDRLRQRSGERRRGIDAAGAVSLSRRTQHDLEALGVAAILGRSEYVDRVMREADKRAHLRCRLEARGWNLDALMQRACRITCADEADLRSGRRTRPEAQARALVAYAACGYLRVPYAPVARRLGVSRRAVIGCAARGRALLRSLGLALDVLLT